MGSEKIFMFGEPSCGCGGGSKADLTAILPALMNNNKGIDPGILAMLGDRNRDGFTPSFFLPVPPPLFSPFLPAFLERTRLPVFER